MRSTGKLFSVIKKYKWLLLSFGIVVAICVVLLLVGNDHIPSWVNWKDKESLLTVLKMRDIQE